MGSINSLRQFKSYFSSFIDFYYIFFKFITARIKSSKASGPLRHKREGRSFFRRTRRDNAPDDASCNRRPSPRRGAPGKNPASVFEEVVSHPQSLSLSHSAVDFLYFMALDNPNVWLQVPSRGVGWLAHARKRTQSWHFVLAGWGRGGARGGKTSGSKRRQETEYIILSTTRRETNDRQFWKTEEKLQGVKKSSVLQVFYKRKHASE